MYGPVCNEIIVLLMDWLCASTETEISLQQNQNGFQQATRSCTLVAVSCTALASLNKQKLHTLSFLLLFIESCCFIKKAPHCPVLSSELDSNIYLSRQRRGSPTEETSCPHALPLFLKCLVPNPKIRWAWE